MLLIGEVGARVLEPGFGHNGDWPSNETFVKHEQMQTLGPVDTVYVGSSLIAFGIDSQIASNATGETHYNAGLSAAVLETWDIWLREFVVPKISPDRVVLGLGHTELNGFDDENVQRFLDAPAISQALEPTDLRRVEEAVQEVSTLFEYRRQLRDVRDLGRAILQPEFPDFWGSAGERQDDFSQVEIIEGRRQFEADPSEERVAGLRNLIGWLDSKGIDVVLVLMPTADGLLDLGADELAATTLAAIAESTGSVFVDGRGLASDPSLFFDGAHLGPTGQDVFTEGLLAALVDT